MQIDTLLSQIEIYYGEYDGKLKSFVKAYLISDFKEDRYEEILKSVLYYHKASFKAPCIASIEQCIKLARQEKELNKSKRPATDTTKVSERVNAEINPEEYKPIGSLVDALNEKIRSNKIMKDIEVEE